MSYQDYLKVGHRLSTIRTADKLHDFLMNPKHRPDLQTPEGQAFLQHLEKHYHNEKTDALMPWLAREWKKGRLKFPQRDERDRQVVEDSGGVWNPIVQTRPNLRYLNPDGSIQGVHPEEVNHWGDFMRSNHPLRRGLGDLMQHQVGDFHQRINDWSEAMAQEAKAQALAGGTVVHTTPDGYTIRQLHTPEELAAEGDAMGHCVGSYALDVANGDSMIYSLRDPQGFPHATVEIEPTQYHHPYEGITDEPYGGDQGMEQNEPIPHSGRVVQIQGKANREPIPEYKQQLAHWFNTFSPEDRPQWSDSAWDRDEEVHHLEDLQDHHLIPHGTFDEYGLKPANASINWDDLLEDSVNNRYHDWYDRTDGQKIYQAARAKGKIPELARALEGFGQKQQDNFDSWLDNNYQIAPHYPDEPHGWVNEEGDEVDEGQGTPYWTPQGDGDGYGGKGEKFFDLTEAMNAYDEAMEGWQDQHPGMQATNHMYQLINPHYNPEAQAYQNEPYQAPQAQPQFPPQTFS